MKNNSLGVLVIATGNYVKFIEPLFTSILKNCSQIDRISFHVFTDQTNLDFKDDYKVKFHYWPHSEWPNPTLLRYHAFSKYIKEIDFYQNLIYLDVDMSVRSDLLKIQSKELFAVLHPGYKNKERKPFDNNKISTSYLVPESRFHYVCGGVQGGSSESYLSAVSQMKSWIESDLDNGIIARWHDESYWNKYVNQHMSKSLILGREYCWPEQWVTTKNPGKIIALMKDHAATRNNFSLKSKVRFLLSEVRMKLLRPRSY